MLQIYDNVGIEVYSTFLSQKIHCEVAKAKGGPL